MAVKMKDVRKGAAVMLKNGWQADVLDNMVNSQTRMCKVYGLYTEMGSCYSSDIKYVRVDGAWVAVELTAAQVKAAVNRQLAGF